MKQFLANVFSLLFAVFAFVFLFIYLQTQHISGNEPFKQILIDLSNGFDSVPAKLKIGYLITVVLGVVTAFAFSIIAKTNKRLLVVSGLIFLFVLFKISF